MSEPTASPSPSCPQLAPASAYQRFFWDLSMAGWSNDNLPILMRLRGALDRDALAGALDDLFRRHEALRTTLVEDDDGVLRQCIQPFRPVEIAELRLRSARSLDDPEVDELLLAELRAAFDLCTGALTRVRLVSSAHADDDHLLVLVLHHAIVDGTSCGVLWRELQALLAARVTGTGGPPPVAAQFRQYVEWERSGDPHADAGYWRTRMAARPARLPVADKRPAAMHWLMEATPLAAGTAGRLHAIAAAHRTTLPATTFAAVAAAFAPWCGGTVRIGTTFANRRRPAFRSVVGPMFCIVPLLVEVRPELTFAEMLGPVRSEWLSALARDVSFRSMHALGDTHGGGCSRYYDVCVNFLPAIAQPPVVLAGGDGSELTLATHPLRGGTSGAARLWGEGVAGFPLYTGLTSSASGELTLVAGGDTAVMPRGDLRALSQHVADAIAAFARDPEAPIGRALAGREPIPALDRVASAPA